MLGNIKFIGELYRLGVLHESIMHKCIKQLISKKKKGTMADLAEDLECLTQIMTTCGKRLDHPKAKSLMDQYFNRMKVLMKKHPDLPSRIRFMLEDVFELRRNNWTPRRMQRDSGPRTLKQIRQEVEEMYPSSSHKMQNYGSNFEPEPQFQARRFAPEYNFSPMHDREDTAPRRLQGSPIPQSAMKDSAKHKDDSSRSFDFFDMAGPMSGRPKKAGLEMQQNQKVPLRNGYASENYHEKLTGHMEKPWQRPSITKHFNSGSPNSSPPASRNNLMRPLFNKLDSKVGAIRPHPVDDAVPVQRGWMPQRNRHSPTIRRTNIDAIQPPFQHAISSAQSTTSTMMPAHNAKKGLVNGHSEKVTKKMQLSKSDVEKISEEMIADFLTGKRSLEETGKFILEMKIQRKLLLALLTRSLLISISKSDEEKSRVLSLLKHFIQIKVFKKDLLVEGTHMMVEKMLEQKSEISEIESSASSLFSLLLVEDFMSLSEIADLFVEGILFPFFLLILTQVLRFKGQDELVKLFNESNIEMEKMLPKCSQNKRSMVAALNDKDLLFLFPLAKIELDLSNQISQNSNPASIYKWVKENVDPKLHRDPGFINVLVSCCLEHITKNSDLTSDASTNLTKEMKDKERHLMAEIKPVLRKFLDNNHGLQLHALYAAQVFWNNKGSPKGLLLRLFNSMYEDDIIDEETFFMWKEDINDSYPGKGKALFQVNNWLKWLHEAETDDED